MGTESVKSNNAAHTVEARSGAPDRRRDHEGSHSLAALLRVATHQLSQPLTVCRGSLELVMLKGRTASDYRAACQRALAAVEKMVSLVEMLQDLAKGSGATRKQTPFELNSLARLAVEELQAAGNSRLVLLRFESGQEVLVRGDENRCRQAAMTVIHHAVLRSAERGLVRVAVATGDQDAIVVVEGKGSPAELEHTYSFCSVSPEDERVLAAPRIALHSSGGRVDIREVPPPNFRFQMHLPLACPKTLAMQDH